jgi:hypothetical protein
MSHRTVKVLASVSLALIVSALLHTDLRAMNEVRSITHANAAVAQFGVTGRGVAVGILDRGIDWENEDFRNEDGTTRIAAILDLSDDSGAASNPYRIGTLYTREQIDAALASGTPLATRDAVGHGTTTTGIMASNGRNLPDRRYRGIAPEATLIVAKVTGGAPAHGDQPAEPFFYDPARLPVAIDFVRDTARELGLPVVMLLNLGSQLGPTDGTSALCRKIDATVGPGKPGIVFVTGPGDDGGSPNRTGGTVDQGETTSIQIQKGLVQPLFVDLWYAGSDRFDVVVHGPSGASGPFTSPAGQGDSDLQRAPDFTYFHQGADVDFYAAANGKREIFLQITGPVGTYTIDLVGASVTDGRFDGTLGPAVFAGGASANRFLTHVAPGSIWDGATAFNNICPGDYVFRTSWTDVDGVARTITTGGSPGEIWRGSSTGPTFDGRLGVDVCAPGDILFTTYNPKSHWATFRANLIEDGEGLYGTASAVSAAAPVVTGIIALMLEADPALDAAQVKEFLHRTARSDRFTGQTPNPTWGNGKVDAFGAVALSLSGQAPEIASVKVKLAKGTLTVTGSGFASEVEVFVDGIPFVSPARLKNGKVVQKGALANGMRLQDYLRRGVPVAVVVRNAGAGADHAVYTLP